MKVIVDKGIKSIQEIISLLYGFDAIELIFFNSSEIKNSNIKDADVLLVRSTVKVNELLLDDTNIKLIGSATAGIDHMDVDYLKKNHIKWFYAPGCNALSVVNYVMSSICFLREEGMFDLTSSVGIIGYGNIGKNLKKALDYFSIENFIYDPFLNFDFLVDIDQIKNCNLITLHVPLTYKTKFPTRNIIDEVFLSDMQGKTIINTSRGGVVDESKLINLQNTNYISDVWIGEPCPSNEIINFALLATPHIAGHSIDGKINGTIMLMESLQNCIDINTDQKKLNLHVMKNFISSNDIGDEDEFFIDNYNKEYDIKLESDIFKKKYINSNIANKKNIFNEVRSNHLARKDFKI
ncbi:erythronate-4-phosphate dehydrogenase [Gammaproteobacteria bacterium]|jgi:erythronate-4-phosphate dehydrogenase|nr:erythronate-4-phosphate dehydrogenase [Gammaproteobacteria bacterium]